MSHRYLTRFQLKKAQEQPLQATMARRYPTRFQLEKAQKAQAQPLKAQPRQEQPRQEQPRQSVASQTDMVQDELKLMRQQADASTIVNYFLARAATSKSFLDKMAETIKLFEYLYEHPVLLTTHLRFKDVTWHKMAQLDNEMTNVLMRLPATFDVYDQPIRANIARLYNLMNMIRQKYY
jgi:hypothetical protein